MTHTRLYDASMQECTSCVVQLMVWRGFVVILLWCLLGLTGVAS